ncbi:MAG: response regulator transcription factor [Campylobacterales bacterium]
MENEFKIMDQREFHILFIEDDESQANLICNYLEKYFKNIEVEKNGKIGFQKFLKDRNKYDVIITDINIPDIDGIELAKEVRRVDKRIPIIAISAYDDKEYLLGAINSGMNKYILKPFKMEELYNAINECLFDLSEKKIFRTYYKNKKIIFDYMNRRLIAEDHSVRLTSKECEFLMILIMLKNFIVTYDEVKEFIWHKDVTNDTLYSFVKRLRKKLPAPIVKTISKHGYKLNV